MKTFFLSLFILFSSILLANEENVVLSTPTGDIYGTLLLPEKNTPVPVVLIISGSGPTDRNGNQAMMPNNSLKYLAEGLEKEGIASLRFDKRGIGESQKAGGKEEDMRFENNIDDVRLWVDLLAKDARFSSVIIAGHSEGSLIGMVASENNGKVKAYISISGVALPADEIIKEQIATQPQQVKEMIFPILEELKQGKLVPDVSPMLYALFRPSVQPYMISWLKYNPQDEIRKLTIPVLIVQGNTDIQVSVEQADLLATAYPKAQKVIVESMNHVLKTCNTKEQSAQVPIYTNPELPLSEKLLPAIIQFVKSN